MDEAKHLEFLQTVEALKEVPEESLINVAQGLKEVNFSYNTLLFFQKGNFIFNLNVRRSRE